METANGAPDVSVVIVNTDTLAYLQRCLDTIPEASKGITPEVLIVDNASRDGSYQWVRRTRPEVHLIALSENVGFARANNFALREAHGRYALLLNPDMELTAGCVSEVVRFLDTHPDVGICGIRLLKMDGQLDWSCRRSLPTPWNVLSRLLQLHRGFPRSPFFTAYELRHLNPGEIYDVGAVSGAFMMVRMALTPEVGLMDERFFLYAEDVDYCTRVVAAGYRTVYYGKCLAYHHKGAAVRQALWRGIWYFHWTALQYYRKYWSHGFGLILSPFVLTALTTLFAWSVLSNALKVALRQAVEPRPTAVGRPRPAEVLGGETGAISDRPHQTRHSA